MASLLEKLTYSLGNDDAANEANTGFTGITSISRDPGGTMLGDDEWMPRGRPSIISTGTDQTGQLFAWKDIAATDALAFDIPWRPIILGASPNPDNQIFYMGAGETRLFSVNTLSTGGLRVRDAASTITNSPTGLLTGGNYVLSCFMLRHATAGAWRVALFAENGTTALWDSGMVTGVNTGSASITRFRTLVAKQGSTNATPARHAWGEPRWDRGATNLLKAWAPHRPFYVWKDGAYVAVDVYRWDANSAGYVQLGTP